MFRSRVITVWFFAGALMLLDGLLIASAGVYQFWHPPVTALPRYHASFWGGLLLVAVGGLYVRIYWPGKED